MKAPEARCIMGWEYVRDPLPKGECVFIGYYDSYWGEGRPYISPVVRSPTKQVIEDICNECISITGDRHHVFFEGLAPIGKDTEWSANSPIKFYRLCFGS